MKTKHLRLMQRVYIILFFCFMYLPIAYMIVFSFNQSKGYSLFTGFTLKWYRSLFTNASILHALWVSVEVAVLSAIIATVLGREWALTPRFLIGFAMAIAGIVLIGGQDVSTEGAGFGDLLAIGAALSWGVYSNVLVSLDRLGYETVATTKRIFAWGLLFIAVACPFMGADPAHVAALTNPVNWGNFLFLGLVACALCFVTWGMSVKLLGASTASVYIYLSPVITVVASALVLGETLTPLILLGIVLVLGGLILSSWKKA